MLNGPRNLLSRPGPREDRSRIENAAEETLRDASVVTRRRSMTRPAEMCGVPEGARLMLLDSVDRDGGGG